MFGIARSTIHEMAGRGQITIDRHGGTALLKVAEIMKTIESGISAANRSGG